MDIEAIKALWNEYVSDTLGNQEMEADLAATVPMLVAEVQRLRSANEDLLRRSNQRIACQERDQARADAENERQWADTYHRKLVEAEAEVERLRKGCGFALEMIEQGDGVGIIHLRWVLEGEPVPHDGTGRSAGRG